MTKKKKLQLAWIIVAIVMVVAMIIFTILPALY